MNIADILINPKMRNSDKGLYMLIMQLQLGTRPDGETKYAESITLETLVSFSKDGRDAVQAQVNRLKQNGYLQVLKVKGEGGQFKSVEYRLLNRKSQP